MAVIDNIGVGDFTEYKQAFFAALVQKHMGVCQAIFRNHAWAYPKHFYFDLTSGTGFHPETGDAGSVMLYLAAASRFPIKFEAHFFEKKQDNYIKLFDNASAYHCVDWFAHHGDHLDLLPGIIGQIPDKSAFGLMYYDPNSPEAKNGRSPSIEMLAALSHDPRMKRIDILIHLAANQIKRARGAFGFDDTLEDWLAGFDKDIWLTTEPSTINQHVMLLGTQWTGLNQGIRGLFNRESKDGSRIWNQIVYTRKERQERVQPSLFR